MLYITERALAALAAMRAESNAAPGESIVLYLEEDGTLGLALGEIEEGDDALEDGNENVVIVSEDLAEAFDGMSLDVEDTEPGEPIEFIIMEMDEDEGHGDQGTADGKEDDQELEAEG